MRFSLKWMLAAVAFVGIGSVALYNANQVWAAAAISLTVLVLLVAMLGSIYLHPRAFYIGMCIFGLGYVLLNYAPIRDYSIRPLVATDVLLDVAYSTIHGEFGGPDDPFGDIFVKPVPQDFEAVGHSLFALVFAIIGGVVGQWFSRGAKCDSA